MEMSGMRRTDVAVVGGGLAGSTAAAMLGRAGLNAILIDPHRCYPQDFRSEKLSGPQIRILRKTGLAEPVLRIATAIDELWVARFGRLVERRRNDQYGIPYDGLVNTIRDQVPQSSEFIPAKVAAISTSSDRQRITLSNGELVSARLIVLATGLNNGLRHGLGITREELGRCYSISIGFDLEPVGRHAFGFPALTYHAERTSDRIAYLTLFPIGSRMRSNLFVYLDKRDPWLRHFNEAPRGALLAAMPGLNRLTGDFTVTGAIRSRPVDLFVTRGYRQAGIVLVGDAFSSSCPAAGTGVDKVFTDVERLCNIHIPRWLATPGMGEEKIAGFYDDPVKVACDSYSASRAFYVRAISLDPSLPWRARRWSKFIGQLVVGRFRHARRLVRRSSGQSADVVLPPRPRAVS
jgi:2-polyprenyl-6-methoxyphenol hydroxylase-like FAD-dependent oxidoreductase